MQIITRASFFLGFQAFQALYRVKTRPPFADKNVASPVLHYMQRINGREAYIVLIFGDVSTVCLLESAEFLPVNYMLQKLTIQNETSEIERRLFTDYAKTSYRQGYSSDS